MDQFKNITTSLDDGVFLITINRPDKMNALNALTIEEIGRAIQIVYDKNEIKGAIITGEGGKAFVAGADISEIAGLNEMNGRSFSEKGQEVFELIEHCDKPIIAAIDGFTLGGGCELAMACHIRLATKSSRFGQPEVNLGVIPGYGGTQRLPKLVGKGRAFELILTGDIIDAEEAYRIGLVNHLAENRETLFEDTHKMIKKIMSKAPLAIGMSIECINTSYSNDENGYQTEANSFASCCKSEDFREGTTAFLEKRKANFKGQ